jgi:hypothetical protein
MEVVMQNVSEQVEALRQAARVGGGGGPDAPVPPDGRVPFPVHALPAVLRQFVQDVAEALGVPPECVATPALATCATAIGNTCRICVQLSQTEPSVLWAVTLLEHDSWLAPAYHAAIAPLVARQDQYDAQYQEEEEFYTRAKQLKKSDPAKWKRYNAGYTDDPEKPAPAYLFTAKGTVDTLATLLARHPRGLALMQDDLSGFVAGLGACQRDGGEKEANFLEFYNAGTVKLNRINRRIFVPTAALSILGTCPPTVFRKAIGAMGSNRKPVVNRLAASFILASPEPKPQPRRASKPCETGPYHHLIGELLAMPLPLDPDGRTEPTLVPMLPEAQESFYTFVDEHDAQTAAIRNPALRAHYANLGAVAARLALIFYLCDNVSRQPGELPDGAGVQERHVLAGIALARWYGLEATRVYAEGQVAGDRNVKKLLELARSHGGHITVGEMSRAKFRWRNPTLAEADMHALARAGHGKVITTTPGSQGGRPSMQFVLAEPGEDRQTSESPENIEVCR